MTKNLAEDAWQSLPFSEEGSSGVLDRCRSLMEPHVQPRDSVSEQCTCCWSVIVWNNHCPLRVLGCCDTQSSLGLSKQVDTLAADERMGQGIDDYHRVRPDYLFTFYSYSLSPDIWGDSWPYYAGCRRTNFCYFLISFYLLS